MPCPSRSQRSPRSRRQRRPQRSLLQRLWSLSQSLRRRLRRLLCPRRPPSEEAAPPETRTSPNWTPQTPEKCAGTGATASRAPRASEG